MCVIVFIKKINNKKPRLDSRVETWKEKSNSDLLPSTFKKMYDRRPSFQENTNVALCKDFFKILFQYIFDTILLIYSQIKKI